MRGAAQPVPLLAIHGDDDEVVAAGNAIALVRQYLAFNGHPAVRTPTHALTTMPEPDLLRREHSGDRLPTTTREWLVNGRLVARHVAVEHLGHAWSGGDATLPFNAADGPDATAMVAAFMQQAIAMDSLRTQIENA